MLLATVHQVCMDLFNRDRHASINGKVAPMKYP